MQLKNSSPVAMEKRMDLASLFCMIGRHGPAVAVAVIAMVSVLAGFIIYRNVKGKRRKAAAGAADGDGRSPGMMKDASLQPEESRSRVESTDVSDELAVKADADVTRSRKIRNRRAPAEKKPCSPPRKYSDPDGQQLEPLVQDSCSVQSNASTAENVDVEGDVCQDVMEDTEAAKEDHDGCLKPAAICESHVEKVLKLEEDEKVTTQDVLGQSGEQNLQFIADSPASSEQNTTMSLTQDGLADKEITAETNCTGSQLEEPVHTDADIKDNHHPDHSDFSKDGTNFLQEKEMKNEAQEECVDKLAALQQEVGLLLFKQTSLPFSQQDDGENMKDEMPSIQDGDRQQEPENDPTCDEEGGVEKEMLPSCDEVQNLPSVVLGHALPLLNQSVDPDMINDALCDPTADARDLQPKDDMIPELAEDAVVDGLCPDVPEFKNIQGETEETTAVMPSAESVELSVGDPDAAVCEKASLTSAVTSTEIPHPEVLPPFQYQKSDQIQNLDLPAPDMTEGIKPPICQIPLSFDQIELMWSSSGAGEESGISSMTVSPALQDLEIECDITSESATHLITERCLGSEEQTGVQIQFFADDEAVSVNKDAAVAVPGSLHLSQKRDGEQTNWNKSTGNEDMFGHEDVYHGAPSQSAGQVSELKKEMDVKMEAVEGEKKDDEKTEISIMAATMDNNEWITDGNYQVLPWMNLSVPSLTQNTQTDPCSTKEHHSLLPVDASRNAANAPSTEAEQYILPCVDNIENDKKIVAVQPMPQNVTVTFRTHYLTHSPYQKVAITGNQQELGNWKEFIPLERAKDGHWVTVVSLPAESHVEWKFVVLDKGEVCRWEECGNRLLDTGYGDDLLVHKWWGFL